MTEFKALIFVVFNYLCQVSACCLVCQQEYKRTIERISTKLAYLKQIPLTFGANACESTDP